MAIKKSMERGVKQLTSSIKEEEGFKNERANFISRNTQKKSPSSLPPSYPASTTAGSENKRAKTRIIVKYDVGYPNVLYLRGKGANLSWEKGIPLKNIKSDEWLWESDLAFTSCEFKVLINDKHYEIGNNHPLTSGMNIQYTPKF